jgi:hypothetical protein
MGKFFENLYRPVCRSPVNNNMFNAAEGLRRHTFDRLPEKTSMVEGRGHNREHWLRDIDKILTNLSLHDQTDKQGMGSPRVEGSLPLQAESIRL